MGTVCVKLSFICTLFQKDRTFCFKTLNHHTYVYIHPSHIRIHTTITHMYTYNHHTYVYIQPSHKRIHTTITHTYTYNRTFSTNVSVGRGKKYMQDKNIQILLAAQILVFKEKFFSKYDSVCWCLVWYQDVTSSCTCYSNGRSLGWPPSQQAWHWYRNNSKETTRSPAAWHSAWQDGRQWPHKLDNTEI